MCPAVPLFGLQRRLALRIHLITCPFLAWLFPPYGAGRALKIGDLEFGGGSGKSPLFSTLFGIPLLYHD